MTQGFPPIVAYLVDWGDGGSNRYTATGVQSHTYADGLTDRMISITLEDSNGVTTPAGQLPVSVHNVAPRFPN